MATNPNPSTALAHLVANALIAEFHWQLTDLEDAVSDIDATPVWDAVMLRVETLGPAELGLISACGNAHDYASVSVGTTLYQVHTGSWIGKYWGGLQILQSLATTALIALMYDLLVQAEQSEKQFAKLQTLEDSWQAQQPASDQP